MSRSRFTLHEYSTEVLPLTATAARDIASVASGKVSVAVGPSQGEWAVTAGGYVGTVATPDVELLLRPKIPLHNLFLLLDVGLPPDAWRQETFAFGTDRNLLPAVAAFFARMLERALTAGLRRDYRAEEERLVALRGRIDLREQMRTPGLVSPMACRFDDYTADIVENRVLKGAVRYLLRVPGVRPDTRRLLERELGRFEEVMDTWPDPAVVDRMTFTRLNRHYRPVLRLAQVILRNTALLDRVGSADASAFLLDMPALFQLWVTDRLQRHLRGQLVVQDEPTVYLGADHRVAMAPDLLFASPVGMAVYVGDAKYKLTYDGSARSGDWYQLLAYTTALDLPEGVLIYCQPNGHVPEREVVVKHSGKRLWTYALPLAGSAEEVEAGVVELARWIVSRAAVVGTAGAVA